MNSNTFQLHLATVPVIDDILREGARRALQVILDTGDYDRDGRSAGDAMSSIMNDAERLSLAP